MSEQKQEKSFKKRIGRGMSVQQNRPVIRHALSRKNSMYYSQNSPKFILECQASKTLALKWFQDRIKFQTIQPGKTYAQALLLGKKLDPVRGDLRMKQIISNQVPVTARSDRGS